MGSLGQPYDQTELKRLPNLIANSNKKDLQAYYKWGWLLVNNLIERIKDKDCINALLEVSGFWLDIKSPPDMPYQYQGMGNGLTPTEFYTQEHLMKVILESEIWLKAEKEKFTI